MKRKFIRDHVNIDDVRKMLEQGKTWIAISIHYEFSQDAFRRYCHQHGIYVRGPYKKEDTG